VSRAGAAQVGEVQRARILAAMARVVSEEGIGSVTVARVVVRAGVSRRTFYEQFSDCEDCFLAVFDDAIVRAGAIANDTATASARQGWREQVRAGLGALLVFFGEEPSVGALLVVDALGAGPRVLERRAQILKELAAIVDRGRAEAQGGRGISSPSPSSPSLTAEGVVGAVLSVIHARMYEHGAGHPANGSRRSRRAFASLSGLLNPLMGMIVLPYLGQAAARQELERPVPEISRALTKSSRASRKPSGDALEGLNMRLTYRTLVVLAAIGADPGASNRQIAERAGVHDQGQISKLLGRLDKLGLIRNTGNGQPRGEPNAWALTDRGREVRQVLPAGH
jgi:AcrR family transcriptional regulator/DNA-binding MarR family transcriptional regulator